MRGTASRTGSATSIATVPHIEGATRHAPSRRDGSNHATWPESATAQLTSPSKKPVFILAMAAAA